MGIAALTRLGRVVLDRALPHKEFRHSALPETVQYQYEAPPDVVRCPSCGLWSMVLCIHPSSYC